MSPLRAAAAVPQIEPLALRAALSEEDPPFLLDVREKDEFELVSLPGSELIPLMQVESQLARIKELARNHRSIVVVCRSGARSEMVIRWLMSQGVKSLVNLRGGINAYANEADDSLTPY